eukprot:TRINITY_DN2989_c0_g1_i1.p1 TRINITY_DN2989_c0_g1~~TRINITY_DN2989_c0_g1_i1.p1  ORF type:complete len:201 (-),score=32.04 TRINITY_DN2989_c0_g1_i1:79-681(-)
MLSNFLDRDSEPVNILDRPLPSKRDQKREVSLSSFCYLYSEIIQYHQKRTNQIKEFERRLADTGYDVGLRMIDYITWRKDRNSKREIRLESFLHFIANNVWRYLFGQSASVEIHVDIKGCYMITEEETIISKFISTTREYRNLNCAAFVGGLIEGLLDAAEFEAVVSTRSAPSNIARSSNKTVIVIEFSESVLEREANLK